MVGFESGVSIGSGEGIGGAGRAAAEPGVGATAQNSTARVEVHLGGEAQEVGWHQRRAVDEQFEQAG